MYIVAAILWLLFNVHVMLVPMINVLYLYIITSPGTRAVPKMAVFFSSLIFVRIFSEWFWDDASCPYYYWHKFYFYTPHSLYFCYKVLYILKYFGASFLSTFLSLEISVSLNIHAHFFIVTVLLGMVLPVFTCSFRNVTCWYQCRIVYF